MIELASTELQLSAVQRAWLQELGLDRAYLSRISQEAEPDSEVPLVVNRTDIALSAATRSLVTAHTATASATVSSSDPAQEGSQAATSVSLQEAINTLRRAANIRPPSSVKSNVVESPDLKERGERIIPDDLEGLRQSVSSCMACDLHQSRYQAVFGRGASAAVQWLIVADAPGDADDKSGVALDGHAGKLLSGMLASVGLDADEHCFITQLVKCRPLSGQGPNPAEIEACSAYILKQIELFHPQYILALGQLAANQLLGNVDDIEQLRSRVHHWESPQGRAIPVVVSYHPAALLLRPQHKANAWRDLALVRGLSQSI